MNSTRRYFPSVRIRAARTKRINMAMEFTAIMRIKIDLRLPIYLKD